MSCNGCRVLRKGCSDTCVLRPCLLWIQAPESQGHATVFVAKFFGRADLMSFLSNVPDSQRPALFQSLLYEACGRTVNPVSGAVGLLWTGNWHVCQAAVETVLRGGSIRAVPEFLTGIGHSMPDSDECQRPLQSVNLDLRVTKTEFPVTTRGDPAAKMLRPRATTPSLNSEESGTTISFESGSAGFWATPVPEPQLLNLFV